MCKGWGELASLDLHLFFFNMHAEFLAVEKSVLRTNKRTGCTDLSQKKETGSQLFDSGIIYIFIKTPTRKREELDCVSWRCF